MPSSILLSGLAFLVAYLLVKRSILFSSLFQIRDNTDERKIHEEQISALGGIGVVFGILIASLFAIFLIPDYPWLLALAIFPLFLLGIWDDAYQVSVKSRLLVQSSLASLIWWGGYRFPSLPEMMLLPGLMNYGLSIFFILLLINAYNLIDGINGLCGGLGVMAFLVLGSLFGVSGAWGLAGFSFICASVILSFLRFNFGQAKIFLGDNGSTVTGFLVAVLILKLLSLEGVSAQNAMVINALGLSVAIVPVVDLFKVAILRVLRGRSPFSADRSHVHHYLLNCGCSHRSAALILFLVQGFLILIAGYCNHFGWPFCVLGMVVVLVYFYLNIGIYPKKIIPIGYRW